LKFPEDFVTLLKVSMNVRYVKALEVHCLNQNVKKRLGYKILPAICSSQRLESVKFILKETGIIEKEEVFGIVNAID